MEEKETNKAPDFRGKLDVALWKKTDKNGKDFYTIKIGNICNVFPVAKK